MISGFENMNMKRLEGFINMLENFPAVIPDLNQFIMRSGTLRMASGATSAALIGSSALQVELQVWLDLVLFLQ